VGHFAAAVDEDADLPTDLGAELAELASEFVADDALHGDAAAGQSLQPAYLAGLETAGVAFDVDGATSLGALMDPIYRSRSKARKRGMPGASPAGPLYPRSDWRSTLIDQRVPQGAARRLREVISGLRVRSGQIPQA